MRPTKPAALLLFLHTSCAGLEPLSNVYTDMGAPVGDRCVRATESGVCDQFSVGFADLIGRPSEFHDKNVQLVGYVRLEFEGNVICPTKQSINLKDCVWLDIEGVTDPGFRRGAAIVEGRFDGESRGHFGLAGGTIREIKRIKSW